MIPLLEVRVVVGVVGAQPAPEPAPRSSAGLVTFQGACSLTLTAAEAGALLIAAERSRRRAPDPDALERAVRKVGQALREAAR